MTTFAQLGLAPELLRAIIAKGYDVPTPIQAQAIPAAMEGRDILGAAQTGTGKTAGFSLPMLHRLAQSKPQQLRNRPPRALILTPTRELAAQVEDSVRTYGLHTGMTSTVIFGGVGIPKLHARVKMTSYGHLALVREAWLHEDFYPSH